MPWRTRHLARHHPQALLFLPILLPPHAHIRKDASGKSKVTCSGRFLPHAARRAIDKQSIYRILGFGFASLLAKSWKISLAWNLADSATPQLPRDSDWASWRASVRAGSLSLRSGFWKI